MPAMDTIWWSELKGRAYSIIQNIKEWGEAESISFFDDKGEKYVSIRTTYETIALDDN